MGYTCMGRLISSLCPWMGNVGRTGAYLLPGTRLITRVPRSIPGTRFWPGKRQVVWETIEGLKLRNKDYSYKGIAAELGLLVKVRKMALTLGVITIKGEYWEPTVGVGINF